MSLLGPFLYLGLFMEALTCFVKAILTKLTPHNKFRRRGPEKGHNFGHMRIATACAISINNVEEMIALEVIPNLPINVRRLMEGGRGQSNKVRRRVLFSPWFWLPYQIRYIPNVNFEVTRDHERDLWCPAYMRLRFSNICDFVKFPNSGFSKATEDPRTPVAICRMPRSARCIYCSCFVDDFPRGWIADLVPAEVI